MAASDDDEDFKRAVEMSLAEAGRLSPQNIDLVDSDDEDLRQAIALSIQDNKKTSTESPSLEPVYSLTASQRSVYCSSTNSRDEPSTRMEAESLATGTAVPNPPSGSLGLDRKAMEQERLARLGKRKRSISPEGSPRKVIKASPTSSGSVPGKGGYNNTVSKDATIQYSNGVIKRTWAYKHPRTDDLKIEEVFQAPNIAILSAMDWEDKWVFSKLKPKTTKQIWIMNAKGQDLQEKLMGEVVAARIPNFKPHFPPMDGNIRAMHSKLMLLFHESHLRIVVPTANMMRVHWGETNQDANGESWQAAVMENSMFLIDLPRRLDGDVGPKKSLTRFGTELFDFLEAQRVGKNVSEGILKFDFSATEHVAFVHSIPGEFTSQFHNRTGLAGLANSLRGLGLDQVQTIELDYATSSLGAIKTPFLKQLFEATRASPSPAPADFLRHIRIYFPTSDTVKNSTGGIDCGGVITLKRSDYRNQDFPRECMRDYRSTRPGVLSHNKILLARGRKADGTPVAWAYVGSANLSESAWGSQKVLKSGKQGKPNIRNWECGVVVPVPAEVLEGLKLREGEVPPMEVFKDVVEIPFQHPGEPYGDRQPWFFMDHLD